MTKQEEKRFYQGFNIGRRCGKTKNNQQVGKEFENAFLEHLAKEGFWAHFMNPAPDGSQPFDIIALKNVSGTDKPNIMACAFDCKTLKGHRFPLSRIEDNQEGAFEALNRIGVHNTYFVIDCGNNMYCLIPSQEAIEERRKGRASLSIDGRQRFYLKQDIH